jgi:general stress protein YciG
MNQDQTKKRRQNSGNFAAMDPARQREIASMGGKAAHKNGNAHEWSSEEARVAGRKGLEARWEFPKGGEPKHISDNDIHRD